MGREKGIKESKLKVFVLKARKKKKRKKRSARWEHKKEKEKYFDKTDTLRSFN